LRRIALLSPDAPELVASAASTRPTVPPVLAAARARHFIKAHERHLHLFVVRPEAFGDANGLALRACGIVVRDDETVSLQCRHIGERVADEHARGKAARAFLRRLCQADAPAEETGGG